MKTKKEIENQVIAAAVLGTTAFNEGMGRVPAWDRKLMDIIKGNEIGESRPAFTAWLHSWDCANLAAPVTV